MRRIPRPTAWVVAALLIAGCGLVPNDPAPAVDPALPITDCEPPLAFEGETTIAELGLVGIVGDDATRRGLIQISSGSVTHEEFAPPGAPVVVPEGQLLCVTWPDGSGMSMMLPEPFVAGVAPDIAADDPGIPLTPILVGLAILLVAAISWIAFRREAKPSA